MKATVQKQSSKQSLSKVSSEPAVRKCSSKQVFLKFRNEKTLVLESLFNKVGEETSTQVFSCEYCKSFKNSFFYRAPSRCFCQFDKVSFEYWASVDLVFLVKNTKWDVFYQKGLEIWSEYVLYLLLLETIPTRFC